MTNIFQRATANIIANIKKSQKHRAIRAYALRIRLLQSTYGEQTTYTPLQVKKVLTEWGYSTSYDCYGLAMYCNEIDFDEYHRSIGESCDYAAMRSEISKCLFYDDRDFSPDILVDASWLWNASGHHHSHDGGYSGAEHHHDAGGGYCDSGHDAGGYSGGDFGGGGDCGGGY